MGNHTALYVTSGISVRHRPVYQVGSDQTNYREAPVIRLKPGQVIQFMIACPDHPFYLTHSPSGGETHCSILETSPEYVDLPENHDERLGVTMGTLVMTYDQIEASIAQGGPVYYQCTDLPYMGNRIIIQE